MPVSSSWRSGDCSSNFGGRGGWTRSSPAIGPASSIGRPSTSMMRPRVPNWPTGTEIGAPVLLHLHAATQAVGRTHGDGAHDAVAQLLLHFEAVRFLTVRARPLSSISRHFRHRVARNWMSTTAPMH